jgi:hypothetical protein
MSHASNEHHQPHVFTAKNMLEIDYLKKLKPLITTHYLLSQPSIQTSDSTIKFNWLLTLF